MKPYSNPKINKSNPKKWYIEFHHIVPVELKHLCPRTTKRIKKYGDINKYQGAEREANAKDLCAQWSLLLRSGYNPFEAELAKVKEANSIKDEIETIKQQIHEVETSVEIISPEEQRRRTSVRKAFALFLESRLERLQNNNSLSTYNGTIAWLSRHFEEAGLMDMAISNVTRLDIANALRKAKTTPFLDRKTGENKFWSNTTYNKEINMAMTVFNWLEVEDYIHKNPATGKLEKLKQNKTMHKWYDRETAKLVKNALLERNCMPVYRACQFTYHLFIRSKSELMKLKIEDIDTTLKRIHFSDQLSKNGNESYRDYSPEFEKVINEMDLSQYPRHYYVFGSGGQPSEKKCHKDLLANLWRPIREELGLSDKYTIYGWKHTGIIHALMKGVDGPDISYKARHSDLKTTKDYLRDYDITLKHIYSPEDLTF